MSNPYCKGEWVCLSPFGNHKGVVATVRRSAITIVVRIMPKVDGHGVQYNDDDKRHGVAIRCGDVEQKVFFNGDEEGAKQADMLMQACLNGGNPETWSFDHRAVDQIAGAIYAGVANGYPNSEALEKVQSLLRGQLYATIVTG